MENFYKKGLTIIELVIVLAVLSILVGAAIPQFSKMRENQVLKSGMQNILSSIDKARSQTLASINSSQYGVQLEADKIIIFTGTSFTPGAVGNETIDMVSPSSITNVTVGAASGTSGEIYFNRLSGNPSATASIIISTTNYSKIITISATGGASVD